MSRRLGPIFLHLRHTSETLIERFQRADIVVCDSQSGSPLDTKRPPLVVVSDSELPSSLPEETRECLGTAINTGQTILLRVGHTNFVEGPEPEVTLPLAVSERELVQASQLLAEIATLRRAKSEAAEAKAHWRKLAMVDELTSLPNRRGWEAELARRSEEQQGFCIGIIDLDFFKRINDRSGHDVGDAVLRETAKIMRNELRRSDFLARLGAMSLASY